MDAGEVSIVIPALNEQRTIGLVVEALREKLPQADIIVVNDGSTDQTGKIAETAGARVINHDRCLGYGAGLRTGTEASQRPYVLFCDGDGQHSADDVLRIIASCDDHAMVVGVRDHDSHVSLRRLPGKTILRHFINFLAGEKIPDFNSGLRMLKKEVLMKYIHLMPQGFSFSTTTTFALLKTNHRIKWVPITVARREGVSTVNQFTHGPQTLLLIIRLSVLFEPLKVFLTVSAGLMAASIASLLIDLILSEGSGIGDTTVILSISMLLVFMFGLLCDQVSALRRELHE